MTDGRSPAWTAFAHLVALGAAAALARVGLHMHTAGYVPHALVALIGAVLGLIGGYVVAAVLPVLALLLAGAVLGLAALFVVCVVLPATLALGRARGGRARAALLATLTRSIARTRSAFRGSNPRLFALADAMPGLEPAALQCAFAGDRRVVGSVVADEHAVQLGGASGVLVGARGVTRGATVCDALVASPLVIETDDGERIALELGVGEVCVPARSGREATIDADAPAGWAVPHGPSLPPSQPVEVFAVGDGAMVCVDGGVLEGDVLRGTATHPLRLTVLDSRARPAPRATRPASSPSSA